MGYFKEIWNSANSIFEGMVVTFSYLFKAPTTVQYPDRLEKKVEDTLPNGYRGTLVVDIDTCTACSNCMRACPIDCIDMAGAKTERKKGLTLIYFNINIAKCMYCNLCVEACPTKPHSIYFDKTFEGSSDDIMDLVLKFIPDEEALERKKEADELAERKAKEKELAAKEKEKEA